jgi:5-methylcytosine-specific restriction endonuclease McrA
MACLVCGDPVKPSERAIRGVYGRGKPTCGPECGALWRGWSRHMNTMHKRVFYCRTCDKLHLTNTPGQTTYCSRKCCDIGRRGEKRSGVRGPRPLKARDVVLLAQHLMKKAELQLQPFTCARCGTAGPRRSDNQRWCDGCAPLEQLERVRNSNRRRYRPVGTEPRAGCAWCKGPFQSELKARQHKYCSRRCAGLARAVGDKRPGGSQVRSLRLRAAYKEPVTLKYVFKRDRGICRLCGLKVDATKAVPHLMAPVRDHIIPLAAGGSHEKANVQLAHFSCNSRKGARSAGEQLMAIG